MAGAVSAGPIYSVPLSYLALSPIPENVYNQVQDTKTGEYAFGYAGGPVAREESRTADGVTRGAYSYVDAHGIVQHYRYVADDDGFRVAGTNIPTDESSSQQPIASRRKRSLVEAHIPVAVETVHALPVAPLALTGASLPSATSSQSRVQIHKSLKTEIHTPLEAIPVQTVAAVPAATVAVPAIPVAAKTVAVVHEALPVAIASLPVATSSQSRYQIHKSLKTEASPGLSVEAPAAVAKIPADEASAKTSAEAPAEAPKVAAPALAEPISIETESAEAPAATPVALAAAPLSTSSQSRFQIHDSSKVEIHEAQHTIPVAVHSEAAAAVVAEVPAAVKTIETSHVVAPASIATATSNQRHFRIHNSARVELDAQLQPLIALRPEHSVALPLAARHAVGVGLGVVPSPIVAYNTYGTALLAEA